MGGSNQSKLQQKVMKYIEKGDQKKMVQALEKYKIPPYIKLDNCGAQIQNMECTHLQEEMYILHIAASRGSKLILRCLLHSSFQHMIDQRSASNKTPLMYTVLHERVELISVFKEYGAEVNAVDVNGDTALHYACKLGNLAMVQEICKFRNLNKEIKNVYENSASDEARHYKHWDVDDLLKLDLQRVSVADSGCGMNYGSGAMSDSSHFFSGDEEMLLPQTSTLQKDKTRTTTTTPPQRLPSASTISRPASDIPQSIVVKEQAGEKKENCSADKSCKTSNAAGNSQLVGCGAMTINGLLSEAYAEQLTRNYQKIILNLKLGEILPIMYSNGFFTQHVFTKIKSHQLCSDRIEELIEFLYTVTNEKYLQFLQILEDTKQEALANELQNTKLMQECVESSAKHAGIDCTLLRRTKSDRWGKQQEIFSSCLNIRSKYLEHIETVEFADDM